MRGKKALVVGSKAYNSPFLQEGMRVTNGDTLAEVMGSDLLVFTGGPDVHPHFYGEDIASGIPTSTYDPERDENERKLFLSAMERHIPVIGICRGAQILSVLNGGRIVQHVDGHTDSHLITTYEGKAFEVNSTHHQMMELSAVDRYDILGWAVGKSNRYVRGFGTVKPKDTEKNRKEPEVVWFPDSMSLAVQYHPERMGRGDPAFDFFIKHIHRLLGGS